MLTLATTFMALNLSVENWIVALIVLVIIIVLFVAIWPLVSPFFGKFANVVLAFIAIIVLLFIAHVLGFI
jgi:hypothetical protein